MPLSRQVESILDKRLGGIPYSAAVLVNGRLVARRHTPPQPRLPVYSFTKVHIATLVLLAVRAGRITLDTPLSGFCPDVPEAASIRVRALLNHTAGLPDYGSLPEYQQAVAGGGAPWSFDTFAEYSYRRGLAFAPGQGWGYANPGYALLVKILETVWARPFSELVRTRIAAPLGLTSTQVQDTLDDPDICPARSPLLSPDGAPQPVKTAYHPGWVWHRLVASDAEDCVRLLDCLLRRRWLGSALTSAMMQLEPVGGRHPPWAQPGYGLGLMGEPGGVRGPCHGHNGGGPGYTTSAYHFAERAITVAVIAAGECAEAVLDAAFDLHDLVARP